MARTIKIPAGTTRTTRLRKCACLDCGYTLRVSRTWLDRGLPGCPCGGRIVPCALEDALASLAAGYVTVEELQWHPEYRVYGEELERISRGRHGSKTRLGDDEYRATHAKTADGRLHSEELALKRLRSMRAVEAHKARHAALAAHAFGGPKADPSSDMPF